MTTHKRHSEITQSEWIVYNWTEVTVFGDEEPVYVKGFIRPLGEAMKLAGGSIKDLTPHLESVYNIGAVHANQNR